MERAALSLVASALSPIFVNLTSKDTSYFGGDITSKELDNLKFFIIPSIKAAIKVGEEIHMEELKPWLMALRASIYELEDVFDMYEYKHLKAKIGPLPKSKDWAKKFFSSDYLKIKLKGSMKKLQKYAVQANEFVSTPAFIHLAALERGQQRPPHPTVSTPLSQVFGRDQELDFLVDDLISLLPGQPPHKHGRNTIGRVPVFAIHGIGGAGKTTLAQYVYNDSRVADRFKENRFWVHVSRDSDHLKVTRQILEAVTEEVKSNDTNSLHLLQQKLKGVLKSKMFLLVLDDVWCDDKIQWDQILIPLHQVGDVGSRILITTRTKQVAAKLGADKTIPLNELQSEQYRSIFKHYALGDAEKHIDDPALSDIAEQILKKLNNSPLAARMVGSTLKRKKTNVNSWKMILNEDMMNDTIDVLLPSFYHLPPHLQQCFALCSLYPKGFHFDSQTMEDLVWLWIAQGFVETQNKNDMTVEEKGKQYFDELVSHSFFQKVSSQGRYVIHDLLHDLAEKVSKDYCFRIEGVDQITIPSTVMHLSIATDNLSLHIPNILKLANLRTFINFEKSEVVFNDVVVAKKKMFEKLTKLRVFYAGFHSVGFYNKLELHTSIGQLKHLRFLQLGGVNKLPDSLCTLYHLQFLILDGSCSMDVVPKGFHNLINLRYLLGRDHDRLLQAHPSASNR